MELVNYENDHPHLTKSNGDITRMLSKVTVNHIGIYSLIFRFNLVAN